MEKNPEPCIFCRIVAGRAEASVLYEDERILAFMNLRPVNEGEFLVIPKDHINHFCDLSDDLSSHLIVQAQRLSRNVMRRLKPQRVGLVVHGFSVAHAHLIVVPQHGPDDITSAILGYIEDGEIKYDFDRLAKPSRAELNKMARLLA
jgi:histidine triad (HIT) family protein